MLGVMSSNVK